MTCYAPLNAYKSRVLNSSGKRSLVFNPKDGYRDMPVTVPCGQCLGCRLEYSRQWAIRCVHEASLYNENSFVTLTYSPEKVPDDFGLNKKHFQDFMKRLRKYYQGKKIRYFHCGEYGEKNLRPHYHACLFNLDFDDKELFDIRDDIRIYTSNTLSDIWSHGFVTVGEVTFESAAYVARYVLKKITGVSAVKNYERVIEATGEVVQVQPEYTTMSRRPGIGKGWLEKYKDETYRNDSIIIRGMEVQPPKFYDNQVEKIDEIKMRRRLKARKFKDNNTDDRLFVREQVKRAQMRSLKRKLDED